MLDGNTNPSEKLDKRIMHYVFDTINYGGLKQQLILGTGAAIW
jgi:hypothetical protein